MNQWFMILKLPLWHYTVVCEADLDDDLLRFAGSIG
jgi:hypothetical protein